MSFMLAPPKRRAESASQNAKLFYGQVRNLSGVANGCRTDLDYLPCDHFRQWIVAVNDAHQTQSLVKGSGQYLNFIRPQLAACKQPPDRHQPGPQQCPTLLPTSELGINLD